MIFNKVKFNNDGNPFNWLNLRLQYEISILVLLRKISNIVDY